MSESATWPAESSELNGPLLTESDTGVDTPIAKLDEVGGQTIRSWKARVVEWSCLLLLPAALFKAYGLEHFYLLSGADPFIYTGYAESTADLIDRLGYPYYAVRFGLIIPSNLAVEIFGSVAGYYALRWLLAAAGAAALYHLLRRRYRWDIGAAAAVTLLINPIFIRAMMTMYSTTIGVPLIAASAAMLLMPATPRRVQVHRLAAGALLGLTVNSNPFTVMPIAAMLVVWLAARSTVGRRRAAREFGLVLVGACVVTAAGTLIYWVRFGDPNIFSPSIDAARSIGSEQFPGTELDLRWLNFRPEVWLAPISSLLCLLAIRLVGRVARWHEWAAALFPIAMWAFFAFHEFVLGGYMLETYYYSSYLLGPTIIAFAVSLALCSERWQLSQWHIGTLTCLVALAGPLVWTNLLPDLSIWTLNGVLPLTAVAVLLVLVATRWRIVWPLAVIVVASTPMLLSIGSPRDVPLSKGQPYRQEARYFQVFNNYNDSQMDIFTIASEFAAAVPRTSLVPGSVVFWLRSTDEVATYVQWTYLGTYTSLQSPASPLMPELDDAEANLLVNRTPRFLIILGANEAEVIDAEAAFQELGVPTTSRSQTFFQHGPFQLHVTTIEMSPAACDLLEQGNPVPWSALKPCATP